MVTEEEFKQYQIAMSEQLKLFRNEFIRLRDEVNEKNTIDTKYHKTIWDY
jgi:hypothetical protein